MKKIILASLLLILVLSGCVSVNTSMLNDNPEGKVYSLQDVQVYFENDEIPEHTRIATMSGSGNNTYIDETDMIEKLREEAGKIGANAIVLRSMEAPGTGEKIGAAFFGVATYRKGEAIAIYVPSLDEEAEE